jgi:ectoine hydroxylase-related dioxygenase (phytanoyl-CoA dioxygenase family)
MSDSTTVTPADVDHLRRELDEHGFVVLRNVVSRPGLTALAEELSELYARSDKFQGGGSVTGHLNCFPGRNARFIYDELKQAGVVDAILTIREGRRNDMRATMNYNLPGSVAQHYHMDGLFTEDFLVCNVAVVDTDLVNGAIDMVPGTNREFLPYWKWVTARHARGSTRIEAAAGDVLLRKSTTWHRGMPNRSATPRPMASLTFGEVSALGEDPYAQYDKDAYFYPNWYSTSRLGVLREKMYKAAPVTYAAYRFAKSLTGRRGYASY